MSSHLARAGWRRALLVSAPLAFATTGMLHLVPVWRAGAGSDFDHVVPHATLWIGIHIVQLAILSLLALALAALTHGLSGRAATLSRAALAPFLAFYSAFDASVGLSGGLLARYVSANPAESGYVRRAADVVTDPFSEPVLGGVYAVGVLSWLTAVVSAAIAVRRAGVKPVGPILLVVGAMIFAIDHAAPFGPIGMVLWLVGALTIERGRSTVGRALS
jgi:hypothetical protein